MAEKFRLTIEILGDGRLSYVVPKVRDDASTKKRIAWALRRVAESLDPDAKRTEVTEQ